MHQIGLASLQQTPHGRTRHSKAEFGRTGAKKQCQNRLQPNRDERKQL
jgi:hypothetical protein